jgi:hypothetical protein
MLYSYFYGKGSLRSVNIIPDGLSENRESNSPLNNCRGIIRLTFLGIIFLHANSKLTTPITLLLPQSSIKQTEIQTNNMREI